MSAIPDPESLARRLLAEFKPVERVEGHPGLVYTTRADGSRGTVHTIFADGTRRAEVWVGQNMTRLNFRESPTNPPPDTPELSGAAARWPGGGVRVDETNLEASRRLLLHVLRSTEPAGIAALTSRDAVLAAIREFDELGRADFLRKYGYGSSRSYFVRHEGELYDSKAIAGVAVGYQHPDRGPLGSDEFSGGEATVKRKLEQLGFEVIGPDRATQPAVWMVKAGRGDIHAPIVLREGVIAVEWSELDDLTEITREKLGKLMREVFPDRPESTATRDRNELFAFAHEIQMGDLIVLPQQGSRFSLGRVTGPYQHRPDLPTKTNHTHPVEWLYRDLPRAEVPGLNEAISIRGFTVRQLPESVADSIREFADADGTAPRLVLPQHEVDAFAAQLVTDEYAEDERNYKLAVHYVLSALLATEQLEGPDFPDRIAAFFERKVDLDPLELSPEQRAFVEEATAPPAGPTNAFINLCGGGFGVNNFIWIPGAVRDGLGENIRTAFVSLLGEGPLAERIERFRSELVAAEQEAQTRPSWHEKWRIVKPTLSFVGALLAGADPQRYSFYHQTKLSQAYEELVGEWPKASGGALYERVVDFVRDVREALERQGAPARDLIDAQSYLYLREGLAGSRAWIFQGNPEIFDVDGALRSLSELSWTARQHTSAIHGGDRVYFWRAGRAAGLIGVGSVLSEPEERLPDPESEQFNRDTENLSGLEPRVTVSVDDVLDTPIPKQRFLDDPELRSLEILRAPRGTNFAVTPEEDERIRELLHGTSVEKRYFILQQRADRGYDWDEEGSIYHFTSNASGAWKQLSQSPGASFVYYRPGSGGGETARTYFGYGRITDITENIGDDGNRDYLARVIDYQPLPRPVPAAEYDPRPNVQMSIAQIDETTYEELLRRGGAIGGNVPNYVEPTLPEITVAILAKGLSLSERTIRRYHLSLKTRGFVVLSGVSGTGKTWLAEAYAEAVKAKALVVPVAPNWTTNEDLLGYLSPLGGSYKDTPFSQFLRDASAEWEAAAREARTAWPYHLILDEMNLARVEYYFAKFLSAMEIRARAGSALIELAPGDVVTLGSNLSFVGTVNIDETTHLFADKVFDRAQLVELNATESELENHVSGAQFGTDLMAVWRAMREVAPFAYRIADEIRSYVGEAESLGVPWRDAFDEQLFQKVLPKLKGGDSRIEAALTRLLELTEEDYPLTHQKARAMLDGFVNYGFSTYF